MTEPAEPKRDLPSAVYDAVADAMVEHGPDGHHDGHELIAEVCAAALLAEGWTAPQEKGERAAIVAWLRAQAREAGDLAERLSGEARRSVNTTGSTFATAADLIEEGAHDA